LSIDDLRLKTFTEFNASSRCLLSESWFSLADTQFFLKVVDAQHAFVKNDKGVVTHMIMRQGPREAKAPKK
jgi:hypothetical protein